MEALGSFIRSHVPPVLRYHPGQPNTTRRPDDRCVALLKELDGITINFDALLLDQLSAILDHRCVLETPNLPIDPEVTARTQGFAARLIPVKTEVRDLYPFFLHYLFVIWAAFLTIINSSPLQCRIDLLFGASFSADFGLFIANALFAIIEVKQSAVVPREMFAQCLHGLCAEPSHSPAGIRLRRAGTADPVIEFPEYIGRHLLEALLQLITDMDTQSVPYGIFTTYEDYMLIRRGSARDYFVSHAIRREGIPAADSPLYRSVHTMSPLRLLLALAATGLPKMASDTRAPPYPTTYVPSVRTNYISWVPAKRKRNPQPPSIQETSGSPGGSAAAEGDTSHSQARHVRGSSESGPSEVVLTPTSPMRFTSVQIPFQADEAQASKHHDELTLLPIGHDGVVPLDTAAPNTVRLLSCLEVGEVATVYEADLLTHDGKTHPVVVKLTSLAAVPAYAHGKEQAIYQRLQPLWGVQVPKFWAYMKNLEVEALVLEDIVGEPSPLSWATMSETERQKVQDLYEAVHACGVVHNDVQPRHVIVEDGSGRYRLIDFDVSFIGKGTDFRREVRGVEWRFNG